MKIKVKMLLENIFCFDNIMIVAEDGTKHYLKADNTNYICEQGTTVEAIYPQFMDIEDWCVVLDRLEMK